MGGKTPGWKSLVSGLPDHWDNWFASRITDPVTRLRFLRRQAVYSQQRFETPRRRVAPWLALVILAGVVLLPRQLREAPPPLAAGAKILASAPSPNAGKNQPEGAVWLVESRGGTEVYSNGLQLRNEFQVRNTARRNVPSCIVYHTSESQMMELAAERAERLQRLGKALIDYVREERANHFVVDRFGRVFRIVAESDTAYHAGHSLWADRQREYVQLNDKFFGIVFESETRKGDEMPEMTAGQRTAGRLLTEMLRSRYQLPASNCVTHAQVSVNPAKRRIGWHTDWAENFPFADLGLPDNYERPIPAISHFDFLYDAHFFASTGARMWRGVVAAEDVVRVEAERRGVSVATLRQELYSHYQQSIAKERNP
jgi:hypothetical protein